LYASQVYDLITDSGTLLSLRTGNSLLRGCFDECLGLYDRMLWAGVRPDVYTFPSVLRTCGRVKDLGRGREVHVHVLRFGFGVDVDVNNALISMYVKCGDLYSAQLVFDGMGVKDTVSWNAMISGCFENGEFLEGLRLFREMIESYFVPDLMTMTSVISAWGCFDECLGLYDRMLWAGVRPDVYTFPSVLRTCGRVKDLGRGREVHVHVLRFGFGVDVDVNNALISMYV
nr:hypothetical protein [Tanacetum cinerariifolium]